MSDESESENGEEKTLRELEKELSKKENELAKIKAKMARKRGKGKKKLRRSNSDRIFDPESVLIIEETGKPEEGTDYYFYSNKDGTLEITACKSDRFAHSGGKKFLEEEVEPAEVHDHGFGVKHRVWELTGRENFTLKVLFKHGVLGNTYAKKGWQGLRELLEEIRNKLSDPVLAGTIQGRRNPNRTASGSLAHLLRGHVSPRVTEEVIEHALESDLGIEEAITSLSMEDEDFARRYKESEKKLQNLIENWEKVLNHYAPAEDGD